MGLAPTISFARNRQLRALMAAWAAFYIGLFAHFALAVVYVFSAGGASAVGAVTVLAVLPGGLVGPLAATLATNRRPQLHLAIGIGARGLVMVATIIAALSGASVSVMLALVAVDSLMSAAVRPLHGALVVRLADTAAEAAAANAATSSLVSAGALIGPALAGVALGLSGIGWAFVLPAAAFAVGAAAALRIMPPRNDDEPEAIGTRPSRGSMRSHLRAVGAGFRAIAASRPAAAGTTLFVVNMTLAGVWYVGSASVANDQVGLGERGVTTVMTVFGAGGLLGALATLSIVGRRGLAGVLAGAMLGWGITLAAIGAIRLPVPGLALAAGVGAASAVTLAVAPTLVQRCVTRTAMAPAVASLQSLSLVGIAAGATIAPILIRSVGLTATLAIVGGSAVVITLLAWPQLRRADALSTEDAARLAVIRATPMLAPLPALALEQLARAATRLTVPAGCEVIRQGDHGDRFYMIAAGLANVTVDGRHVAILGPGGSFGEIALLHDVERSATVTARDVLDLVTVDRAEFLGALSADSVASVRFGGVVRTRLATPPVQERLVEVDRDTALAGRSVTELLAPQPPLATVGDGALRELADTAWALAAPDGALIIREGDYGHTYYVILDGAADVLEGDTLVRTLGPGDGFGERAILGVVPSTATVRAMGHTTLVAIDRETFERARQTG